MTEQSMVERVARAIKADMGRQMGARPLLGDTKSDDWHALPDSVSIDLEQCARAAIEALREPTEAMLDEVVTGYDSAGYGIDEADAREVWDGMISEALK